MKTAKSVYIFLIVMCCLFFSYGCHKSIDSPPEALWYLGGAPILADFSTTGGENLVSGEKSDIVIYVPLDLVEEGFAASILGMTEDDEVNLLHGTDLTPGEYYIVSYDDYCKFSNLTLHLTYAWNGHVMSRRVIDLFSHRDLVEEYPTK